MTIATAKIIARSEHPNTGTYLTTFELEFPRIILAEVNTHRALSKNTSSSRAIPSTTIIESLEQRLFVPEYWGKNQSGMQAKEQLDGEALERAKELWIETGKNITEVTRKLSELKLHKQLASRISECFQFVRVCMSGTEYGNLFWLRDHEDAQPEFMELAKAMRKEYDEAPAAVLDYGDWHLPYYHNGYWTPSKHNDSVDAFGMTLHQARMISTSCCAQTSFRKNDDSLEKAEKLFGMFFDTDHVHASPAEHQGTPMEYTNIDEARFPSLFEGENEGATHVDKEGEVWSGNFKHWIQHRQLIPNNVHNELD